MIRVVVADDHPIVREGLRRILDRAKGIEVVGETDRGDALPTLVGETNPDVVVMDIEMPGPGFLKVIPAVSAGRPGLRVLVLSGHPEGAYAVHALRAGAAGYLEKALATDQLVEAVHRVHGGGRYVSPQVAQRLALSSAKDSGPSHERLSVRELEVLRLMGDGRSLKQIAAQLRVNAKTISTYRTRILTKLSLKTNAEMVRYAVQHGLAS